LMAVSAPVLRHAQNHTTDNTTGYTVEDVDLGSASADRMVAVCVATIGGNINAVDVNGVEAAAAQVATQERIFIAHVPSGTVVDIDLSSDSNFSSAYVAVYTWTGGDTEAPVADDDS